jgi:hypothetical protein
MGNRSRASSSWSASDWPSWTVIPPFLLTILVCLLSIVVDFFAELVSSFTSEGVTPPVPSNGGWIGDGIIGAIVAVLAAVLVLVAWSGWPRRVAALAIWGILVLQVGWISLTYYLVAH